MYIQVRCSLLLVLLHFVFTLLLDNGVGSLLKKFD